jgi:hypothetical protein
MKTDKNFRLNQPAKRLLALIDDKNERSYYKNVFISNQLARERARFVKIKEKDTE